MEIEVCSQTEVESKGQRARAKGHPMDISEGSPCASMEGLLGTSGPCQASAVDGAGTVMAVQGACEREKGKAVNFFQVMQPGGELRLFRAESLTVGEVLAEYPGHILSLSSFRPLRLPSDTKLLRWNVYHLHSANNGRAITLDRQHERKSLRALHRRRALSAMAGTPSAVSGIGPLASSPSQQLSSRGIAAPARATWSCDATALSIEPEQAPSSVSRRVPRRCQSGAAERNKPTETMDPNSYVVEQKSTVQHSVQRSTTQKHTAFAPWPPPQPPHSTSPTAKPRRTSRHKDSIPRAIPRAPKMLGHASGGSTGAELRADPPQALPGTSHRALLVPDQALRSPEAEPLETGVYRRPPMREASWKHMVPQERQRMEQANTGGGEAWLPFASSTPAHKGLSHDTFLLAKDSAILGHALHAEKALPPWSQDKPGAPAAIARHFPEAQGQRPQRLQRACPMTDVVGLQRSQQHRATLQVPAGAPEYGTPISAAAPEDRMPAMETVTAPDCAPQRRPELGADGGLCVPMVSEACQTAPDDEASSVQRLRQLQAQLQAQASAEMTAVPREAGVPPPLHPGLPLAHTGLARVNSGQHGSRPVTPNRGFSLPQFGTLGHTLLGAQGESCMWEQKITAWDLSLVYHTSHETESSEGGHSLVRGASSEGATLVGRPSYGQELLSSAGPQAMDMAGGSLALAPFSRREMDDRLSSESSECRPTTATGVRLTCKSSKVQVGRCRSYEKSQLEVCQAKVIEKRMVRQHKRNPVPSRFKGCKKATLPPKWPSLATQLSCIEFWYLEQRV